MISHFFNIKTLGVINLTPNSFSDPAKFLNSSSLKSVLSELKGKPDFAFDFGFESTAPMNTAITLELERERFDQFLEVIRDVNLDGQLISFDTYRPENFLYFEECFKKRFINQSFLFNDVSGVIDHELLTLLKMKKYATDFTYVYNNTHIPSRDCVLKHQDFLHAGDAVINAKKNFNTAFRIFKTHGIEECVIFDPGFGFSKTYEQNWELIERLHELTSGLEFNSIFLIGLSKKSFLRKAVQETSDPFSDSEILHEKCIREMLKKTDRHLIFRVHDFSLMERVYAGL
jgi:dihydropteroate synthase